MILDRYLARRFLRTFLGTLLVFFGIFALIDLVEEVRRFSDEAEGLQPLLALTLLNVPAGLYGILPLVTIIAAITMFLGLARSSELVVTRGSGRSALRALLGPSVVAAVLGAVAVAAFNPIVAATSREYESRVGRLEGQVSALALSEDGLWLRQSGSAGPTVIRAERSNLDGTSLRDVTFLDFDRTGRPVQRVEAQAAHLAPGGWTLTDATVWPLDAANPQAEARRHASLELPSSLTADQIRDSFGTPSSIPIWELSRFIARLEEAGFAAQRHRVFLQMELAQPAFMVAMVLIAAAFTMHHQRGRRTGTLVLTAILAGFAVYFLRNLSQVLGEAGQIAPALSAWAPPLVAIGLSMGLLLHLEEG